ncbi:phosphotransferase family protein [Aestuariimicrobium soli]|uniref:phosphotransferase family protein n=1 Tax=Aestuariimicrobium soli TaxID=2035834 RepID=UPI003EC096D2
MSTSPRERILACAAAAGIAERELGEIVPSWSQHTVLVGDDRVLRVCWLGNRERLTAESLLMRDLPAELGCPEVLAHGHAGDLTWALSRRMPGRTLASVWPELGDAARTEAARAIAGLLERLYAHRPSDHVTRALLAVPRWPDDLVGGAILAWPVDRAKRLLADPRCVLRDDQKRRILTVFAEHPTPRVDDPTLPVIHGDLHASNVWWQGSPDEGRVTGLFDLEWARFAEPWADVGRSHERALADLAEPDDSPDQGCHPRLIGDIVRFLPAWQLTDEHLVISTLGYSVRHSLQWDPLDEDSPRDHVVHTVDGLLARVRG